jgi:large subunit ribosomal protein L30e
VIGYKESIKFIKTDSPKIVIIAKNAPEKIKREIEENAKISGIDVQIFKGSSKELGILCGKPFPVTTLVIKG